MSIPIDDETYGDKTSKNPDDVKQGNPGRPQSELGEIKDPADTDHPAGEKHAGKNAENEPAG
jgi:hypothetical protein